MKRGDSKSLFAIGVRRRGIILLSVAWCVLILGLLLATRIGREEMAFFADRSAQTNLNLELCAHSAESIALAGLAADAGSQPETNYDAPSDCWGWQKLKGQFGEDLAKSYPDIELAVQIEDEGGKINPVKAQPEVLASLLRTMGWSEVQARDLDQQIQQSCKTQPTDTANPSSSQAQAQPDDSKKSGSSISRQYLDLRKLLTIPSFTPELLYGEDTNFNKVLDTNENDGNESLPPDDRNGQLRPGLLDYLSIWGDGKANPNMVSLEILMTVPGISKRIAMEIVSRRAGTDGIPGTGDDFIFKSAQDIQKLSSVSKYIQMEYNKMAPYLRMTTDLFRIKICATSKRTGQMLRRQSIVRRKKDKIAIISQCEDYGV